MSEELNKEDYLEIIQTSREALNDSMTLSEEDYVPQLEGLKEIVGEYFERKSQEIMKERFERNGD